MCVQAFAGEREAIALANASTFALGASVWRSDLERARRIASALRAGTCAINDVIRNIANPHAAFGGNGASGYGRYHGPRGLLAFSRTKTIMTIRASRRREIHWFPFTRKNYDGLRTLIELRHHPRGLLGALRRVFGVACISVALLKGVMADGAGSAHLWLNIEVPLKAHGSIAFLIFQSPDGFPDQETKAIVHGFSKKTELGTTARIDAGELRPGSYAVSAYLDENGNHKLDSGLFGIPKEPVGASNNPKSRMGPPRFEDCVFQMGSSAQTLTVRLVKSK